MTHNINTANTVATGNGVSSQEEINGVGAGLLLAVLGELQLDRNTLLEVDGEVLGLVGGSQGVLGQLPHVGGGSSVGILENTGLVRAVGQVLVHAPGLGLGGCDGNALLGSVRQKVVTASEALVEDRITPRGNDLDLGLESVECKLEANLVVTLTSAAVGDSEAALALIRKNTKVSFYSYKSNCINIPHTLATSI